VREEIVGSFILKSQEEYDRRVKHLSSQGYIWETTRRDAKKPNYFKERNGVPLKITCKKIYNDKDQLIDKVIFFREASTLK
jgi:hypothetical protein